MRGARVPVRASCNPSGVAGSGPATTEWRCARCPQAKRGITFVQNRSIEVISFACGTSAL